MCACEEYSVANAWADSSQAKPFSVSALVEACHVCLHYPMHWSSPKQNRLGRPSLALSFAYDTESFLELAKLRN